MDKIVVGVSGGADSMALLDMLYKEGYNIIAAHVNYQVRDNSFNDEKIVRDYCLNHNIELEVLSNIKYSEGNFQAIAREIRYDFMRDLLIKHNAKAIYVAHHQDDLIETYLIQKERNVTPTFYGLNKESKYKDVIIKRILLDYSKEDLINYCLRNNIEYIVDDSNYDHKYTRNRIRDLIVDKMSNADKEALILEINKSNENLKTRQDISLRNYNEFIEDYSNKYILSLNTNEIVDVLRLYFKDYDIYNVSDDEYYSIIDFLKSGQNSMYQINDEMSLSKQYDKLDVITLLEEGYLYTFDKIENFDCEYFKIRKNGTSFEAVTVSEDDFPLTIRNFKPGDKIKLHYGTKRVSRFFIDNKIPTQERLIWPIVLNSKNEIILVPQIGPNKSHYSNNPNMFVVK